MLTPQMASAIHKRAELTAITAVLVALNEFEAAIERETGESVHIEFSVRCTVLQLPSADEGTESEADNG